MSRPSDWPDPSLTASIYAQGHLDSLIRQVLVPLWADLVQSSDEPSYMWFLRYARGGEHLKLRVHGPEASCRALRTSLEQWAPLFFSGLSAPPPSTSDVKRRLAPPLDAEDLEEHPDRSLLWTIYRRSLLHFGAASLMADDRFVACVTRCLGQGCAFVLPALQVEPLTHNSRQALMASLLTSGLSTVWPDPEARARYLVHHRNWLIRAWVIRKSLGVEAAREILKKYEVAFVSLSRSGAIERLTVGPEAAGQSQERLGFWGNSLLSLEDAFQDLDSKEEGFPDFFTNEAFFPVLFRVLHGIANQVGLNHLNEGLCHHLVLRALDPAMGEEISLVPE